MNSNNKLVKVLKKSDFLKRSYRAVKMMTGGISKVYPYIDEIIPLVPRASTNETLRLNLIIPSIKAEHVFGGISTAIKFFDKLAAEMGSQKRLIIMDADVSESDLRLGFSEYQLIGPEIDSDKDDQLVCMYERTISTLPVGKNDIFIATGWWTAYTIRPVIEWQSKHYAQKINNLIYLIQDFEPNFYAWSSRFSLADSTYNMDIPVTAVFNSTELKDFFKANRYQFDKEYCFDPVLNEALKAYLKAHPAETVQKKKQILVYGRPTVARNAFEILYGGLLEWSNKYPNASEWRVFSAGEDFDNMELGNKVVLESVGKLTLDQYAKMMSETYAGISLMISPHPSYPPLEMSTFGIKTITNKYANKDLQSFNQNIISLEQCTPNEIMKTLCDLCSSYSEECRYATNDRYLNMVNPFKEIIVKIKNDLENNS